MNFKRAIVFSLIAHAMVFAVVFSGIKFSQFLEKKTAVPIEARLIIKKTKNKDQMPRKSSTKPEVSEETHEKKSEPAKAFVKKEPTKIEHTKKTTDYMKALSSLSKSFAEELADQKPEEPMGEVIIDATYFDQIYSLIKQAFVVPPHINGPQGQNLETVVKLFLASDGSILRIDLVTPSGDEYFDKAVLDGTRRVNNFGLVPPTLQNMVRERGIVVALCPFTCKER